MPFQPQVQIHKYGFAPDLDADTPGILLDGDRLYPTPSGVKLQPGLKFIASPPPFPVVNGAIAPVWTTNVLNAVVFAGVPFAVQQGSPPVTFPGHLYKLNNSLAFVRNDTTNYNGQGPWRFAVFNNDVIAVNGTDVPQVSTAGGVFGPLGGTPPVGSIVAVVDPGGTGTFAFMLNTSGVSGGDPTFWACSKQGVDNVWSLNVADNSASGFLQSTPGPITGAVALGTNLVAFKPTSVYVGQFSGPPFVWSFQVFDDQYGIPNQEAVVNLGDVLAFANFRAPCFFTFDGTSVRAIENGLWKWFLKNAAPTGLIRARYDSAQGVVYWHFVSNANLNNGNPDTWVAWNITNNRWTKGSINVSAVLSTDAGSFQPAVFIPSQGLMEFTGTPTPGSFTTGYYGQEDRLTRVVRARAKWVVPPTTNPIPAGSQAYLTPMISDILGAPATAMPTRQYGPRGFFDFRQAARWHQFKFTLNVDSEVSGWWLENSDAGNR